MKYLIFIVFLLLPNCSGFTVASLSTNVVTVAATGKTNADLVISHLAGKDCKFFRVALNKEICNQNDLHMSLKKETTEEKNRINKRFIGKVIDTTYYITKNVAKDHAVLGAKIFDKIGITNELEEKVITKFENNEIEEKVITKFENNEIEENLSQKPENNLKKETSISKKGNREEKKDETTWKQRVDKVKVQKNELVEEVKVQKNELIEDAKIKSKTLIEEAKIQKKELIEDAKRKSKTLIEEAKIQKKELVEKAKIQKKELVEKAREKSNELKKGFLKYKSLHCHHVFLMHGSQLKFYYGDFHYLTKI